MTRKEELMQIKKERDEMEKHMTYMFDLAFMLNNCNDIMSPQVHYEKLSRMVTHYMGSIQQSYGYMSDKAIQSLSQEPCEDAISREHTIPITKNATNGDVIKALFPNSIVKEPTSIFDKKVIVFIALDYPVKFHIDWWDAPYKESEE